MSLITSKGSEAKEQIDKSSLNLKDEYISLKAEGESIPVRVLNEFDYVGYKAHGDFNKGIYITPCLIQNCPYCIAKEKGGADWEKFFAKDRFMFAFADLNSKKVKLLDVSRNQAKALIAQIDEYSEEIMSGDIAFNLTKTGSGSSTAYALNVITPKKMTALQEAFDSFDGQVVETAFYVDRLRTKTPDYMVKLLEDAGFPIEQHFDAELVAKARETADEASPITDEADAI